MHISYIYAMHVHYMLIYKFIYTCVYVCHICNTLLMNKDNFNLHSLPGKY